MKQAKLLFSIFLSFVTVVCSAQLQILADEAVTLTTQSGSIHGKILLPPGMKSSPVVLLIAGSGPTDMDGNSPVGQMKNNSLKYLAEDLAKEGIASLRFDKRGIASSASAGKKESDLRFEDYVNDVKGWIDYLGKDPRFTGITVIGHSEGALIGMLACRNNPKVRAFVSLAGAGRPAYELIEKQLSSQPESVRNTVASINASLKQGKLVADVPFGMEALFRQSVQPYMISWYKYNPQQIIKDLKIPVLIVQGKNDIQIGVEDAELLKKATPSAKLLLIEKMNHVLKDCDTTDPQKQMAVYTNPSLPVNATLISSLSSFIKERK
ncbi:alpha/beta hydrolase [Parabacteroides sp.]